MKVGPPPLADAAATFLVACGEEEEATCVDQRTNRVADVRDCDEDGRNGYGGAFVWLYAARGGGANWEPGAEGPPRRSAPSVVSASPKPHPSPTPTANDARPTSSTPIPEFRS